MKHIGLLITASLISGIALSVSAQTTSSTGVLPPASVQKQIALQGGPGIAVSGSATQAQLPSAASAFLKENYPSDAIANLSQNYIKGSFHTQLASGTKITFNDQGKVTQIVAPENNSLPMDVIADVVPQKTSLHLAEAGLIYNVHEIKDSGKNGTIVMLLNTTPQRMLFDVDGTFVIFYD